MTNKTCDVLCNEILEGMSKCMSLGIAALEDKPSSYENFVLLSRVNRNYNIVTIADNNMQIKISRNWSGDSELVVEVSDTEDHSDIHAFLTQLCEEDQMALNEEAINQEITKMTDSCAQLYDLMKAP